MIRGLHHASITTTNIDRLAAFYRDLLGFEVVMTTAWQTGNHAADAIFALPDTAVKMAMMRTENAFFELFEFVSPVGAPGDPNRRVCEAGLTHICLNVVDIQGEYARLKAVGMRFHCEPQHAAGIGWATYGRDPDGNIVELLEPDPGGPFFAG